MTPFLEIEREDAILRARAVQKPPASGRHCEAEDDLGCGVDPVDCPKHHCRISTSRLSYVRLKSSTQATASSVSRTWIVTTLRLELCWIHALPGVAVTMQARMARPVSCVSSSGISTKAERAVLPVAETVVHRIAWPVVHRIIRPVGHFEPGFGGASLTLTTNLPERSSSSRAITLAITSFGTFDSKLPSGASSEPLNFIIEYWP